MPRYTTDAIILNTIDYLESDKIVNLLSRDRGIVHAIAKGAKSSRRRFPGTLEPMSEVSLELFHKPGLDLHRVESAGLLSANLALREDLEVFAHAAVLLEVVMEHLGPQDPHPQTYACLKRLLSSLEAGRPWFALWSVGLIELMKTLGYGIDAAALAERRLPFAAGLSPEAAMFLVHGMQLEPEVLAKVSLRAAPRREIVKCLLLFCNHVSQKPLKTAAFLAKLLDLDLKRC